MLSRISSYFPESRADKRGFEIVTLGSIKEYVSLTLHISFRRSRG
jgi:hypothetical protein